MIGRAPPPLRLSVISSKGAPEAVMPVMVNGSVPMLRTVTNAVPLVHPAATAPKSRAEGERPMCAPARGAL